MKFNNRIYKIAQIDNLASIDPDNIPGSSIEEKVQYVKEHMSQNLIEKYRNQEITDKDLYLLFPDDKKKIAEVAEELRPYQSAINKLLAQLKAEKSKGFDPYELHSLLEPIMSVLDRTVIPQLSTIYQAGQRRKTSFEGIDLSSQQSQNSMQELFKHDRLKKANDMKDKFMEVARKIMSAIPGFTLDNVKQLYLAVTLNKQPVEQIIANFKQNPFSDVSVNIEDYKDALDVLSKELFMVKQSIRVLNNQPYPGAIVGKTFEDSDFNELANISGYSARWDDVETLQMAGLDFVGIAATPSAFFTLNKPNATEEEKEQYKIKQLRTCVRNGYDNSKILIPIKFRFNENKERIMEKMVEKIESEGLDFELDATGKLIKYYYETILNSSIERFYDDLLKAGCGDVVPFLKDGHIKQFCPRYGDFRLLLWSKGESNFFDILRRDYSLDPVPFETTLPVPEEYNLGSVIETDFILPCDIVAGFDQNYVPRIQRRVFLTGEYYDGYRGMNTVMSSDKPFLNPDGSAATVDMAGIQMEMFDGMEIDSADLYKYKTEWKKMIHPVAAHIIGAGSLGFDSKDKDDPNLIMEKLDQKFIVYSSDFCTNNSCVAYKMIENNGAEEDKKYYNIETLKARYEDPKTIQLNYIDVIITDLKVKKGLREIVEMTQSDLGWNRAMMYDITKKINETEFLSQQIQAEYLESRSDLLLQRLNQLHEEKDSYIEQRLSNFREAYEQHLQEYTGNKIKQLEDLKQMVMEKDYSNFDIRVIISNIMKNLNPSLFVNSSKLFNLKKYARN